MVFPVARLILRNIEESIKARLERQAIRHGRSVEEEVRDILRNALGDEERPTPLGSRIHQRFARIGLDQKLAGLRGYKPKPAIFR
jgi:antitoxin FitA